MRPIDADLHASPYGLTCRELEVIELVAGGFSSRKIATLLGIAPGTVESHIDSAKLKCDARSRPNLIAKAVSCGLIQLPDQDRPKSPGGALLSWSDRNEP